MTNHLSMTLNSYALEACSRSLHSNCLRGSQTLTLHVTRQGLKSIGYYLLPHSIIMLLSPKTVVSVWYYVKCGPFAKWFCRSSVEVAVDVYVPHINGTNGVFVAVHVNNSGCTTLLAHGFFFFLLLDDQKFVLSHDLGKWFLDILNFYPAEQCAVFNIVIIYFCISFATIYLLINIYMNIYKVLM